MATASDDKTMRIWDVATCQCVRTLTGHGGLVLGLAGVWDVAFSPDGRVLARTVGCRLPRASTRPCGSPGCSHRPVPTCPDRPHRHRAGGGVQPRRADVGYYERRQDRTDLVFACRQVIAELDRRDHSRGGFVRLTEGVLAPPMGLGGRVGHGCAVDSLCSSLTTVPSRKRASSKVSTRAWLSGGRVQQEDAGHPGCASLLVVDDAGVDRDELRQQLLAGGLVGELGTHGQPHGPNFDRRFRVGQQVRGPCGVVGLAEVGADDGEVLSAPHVQQGDTRDRPVRAPVVVSSSAGMP